MFQLINLLLVNIDFWLSNGMLTFRVILLGRNINSLFEIDTLADILVGQCNIAGVSLLGV